MLLNCPWNRLSQFELPQRVLRPSLNGTFSIVFLGDVNVIFLGQGLCCLHFSILVTNGTEQFLAYNRDLINTCGNKVNFTNVKHQVSPWGKEGAI